MPPHEHHVDTHNASGAGGKAAEGVRQPSLSSSQCSLAAFVACSSAQSRSVSQFCVALFSPFHSDRIEWHLLKDYHLVVGRCDQVLIDLPRDRCSDPARNVTQGYVDDSSRVLSAPGGLLIVVVDNE
jgi:hypothetical protein